MRYFLSLAYNLQSLSSTHLQLVSPKINSALWALILLDTFINQCRILSLGHHLVQHASEVSILLPFQEAELPCPRFKQGLTKGGSNILSLLTISLLVPEKGKIEIVLKPIFILPLFSCILIQE